MTGLTFPQLGSLLLGRYRIRTSSATSPHLPCRFKAFDQQRSRFVHLDVLAKHDHRAAGLRAEYAALSRIFGPAIVEPYDYFEDDTLVVFSTEWIDARPLKSLLAAGLHLHTATKVEILHDLSHALASAHYRSVIHRGLSSESVLIRTCVPSDETQRVMLRGFDARRPVYLSDVMDTGRMLARTVYDAPEIATGHGYSMRSDIYALGVLAFEIFTGALPYGSLSP
ncbi:MAG: protein kinase, partial [Planctomycetales bacterium]|nr:protein kinase [Planctomycetales bacterium]